MGDIIRIHRANIGIYKQYKTFSVNLAFGSSWCIFSGFDTSPPPSASSVPEEAKKDTVRGFFSSEQPQSTEGSDQIRPYQSSSKEFTLTQQDHDIVSRYRAWLQDYFANEFNYESTLYMSLNKVREFIMSEQSSIGNQKMRNNNPGVGNMP